MFIGTPCIIFSSEKVGKIFKVKLEYKQILEDMSNKIAEAFGFLCKNSPGPQ